MYEEKERGKECYTCGEVPWHQQMFHLFLAFKGVHVLSKPSELLANLKLSTLNLIVNNKMGSFMLV